MTAASETGETGLRERLKTIVEGHVFTSFIIGVIVFNAITLGLETVPSVMAEYGRTLELLDHAVLGIFIFELLLKLFVYRLRFFANGWNIFDFVIVGISIAPALGNLSVLRSLRIMRILRLLSVVPRLKTVVEALLHSMPGMGAIVLVLVLIYFVGSVLGTKLFGANHPEYFGTIGDSMFTLFTVMTLEGWADVARKIMTEDPNAWLFFIPFIIFTSFMVLNLFIAVIVNSLNEIEAREQAREASEEEHVRRFVGAETDAVMAELAELRREVAEVRELLTMRDPV